MKRNGVVDWITILSIVIPSLLSFLGGAIAEKEAKIVNNYIYMDNNSSKIVVK